MASLDLDGRLPRLWQSNLPYRYVLVSDLDHTMVQNEDPKHEHLLRFDATWCSALGASSALVYSTGRSPELYRSLWAEAPLLTPQVLICSVGTEIFILTDEAAPGSGEPRLVYRPDPRWVAHLDGGGWDRAKVVAAAAVFPQLKPQGSSEQRPHKISFHLDKSGSDVPPETMLDQLRSILKSQGLPAKVIYSGGVDVDILSDRAGKGRALEFVLGELKAKGHAWPELGVQVNGDSGNDVELFEVPGVQGCIVSNAHPELRRFAEAHASEPRLFQASLPCSGGIREAMSHFGTLARAAEAPAAAPPGQRRRRDELDAAAGLAMQLGDWLLAALGAAAGAQRDGGPAGAAAEQGGEQGPTADGVEAASAVVPSAQLPEALSLRVPEAGLSLRLGRGLSLQPGAAAAARSSWVDLLELSGPPEGEAHAAAGGHALFHCHALAADGTRDVPRSLACRLAWRCDGKGQAVAERLSASRLTEFVLP